MRDLRLAEGSSPAFALPVGGIAWAAIKRGESLAVSVRFTPDGREHRATIGFEIDRPGDGPRSIQLIASRGQFRVTPSELNFGMVAMSCPSRVGVVTAYNLFTMPLRIESVRIVGSTAFKFSESPDFPKVLEPGGEVAIGILVRASEVGDETATLEFAVAQSASPVVARLGAQSVLPGPLMVSEAFRQNERPPKVDALFVIDDSPSMADKQQSLRRNLEKLLDEWDSRCVDYQVAFTTTAVDAAHGGAGSGADFPNGRFLPLDGSRPRIVDSALPDRRPLVLQNADVGTSGTALEYLLRPVELALSSPLSSSENAGFLRPGASLEIRVVSDSADHDTSPVEDYAAFLNGLGREVRLHAVVPTRPEPPAGCAYGEADAGGSTRARDLAMRAGGGVADICDADWHSFQQVWGTGRCPKSRFYLSDTPRDPEWIRVKIDGVPFGQVNADGKIRWRYDAAANAVDFEPGSVPPPSAEIELDYAITVLCKQ